MTPTDPDALAKSRLLILTLVRLAGIVLMMFGLLIAAGDLIRDGGWPAVGVPIALIGFIESLLLPKYFAAKWRSPTEL